MEVDRQPRKGPGPRGEGGLPLYNKNIAELLKPVAGWAAGGGRAS